MVRNRLLGIFIGIAVIAGLVVLVFGTGRKIKMDSGTPELRSVKELISEKRLDEAIEGISGLPEEDKDATNTGKIYFNIAREYEKNNELVKARDAYAAILGKYQNIDNILEVQQRLGDLNVKILFSPITADDAVYYKVEPGDTLSKIARKFSTTVDLIKASNSLESDVILAGSKLKVAPAKYTILVDKSQNILTLFSDDDKFFKAYQVSTGENNCTPVGKFKIVTKIKDPVWYNEGAIVPAESPDNILGSRWLGISEPGYGIHGTTQPESLGKQATRGCIRMLNKDVEELYTIVTVGTEVTIVD